MNIPERINRIIAERQARLPLINQIKQQLQQVNEAVLGFDDVCKETVSGNSEKFNILIEHNPDIAEKLRSISVKKFKDSYKQIQDILSQLENRFSREQIHISFVGRAGQGKSLVMQSISGLSGNVIPSSDGEDCTGAKSIITNRAGHKVTAEITFYTRQEYQNIVNKYLLEIFETGQYEIDSVDEIKMLKQKNLRSQVDATSAKKQALYVQFEKYIEHSEEVLPLLGTVKTILADEIENYVAQYSSKNKSQKYFMYLGVKVANIFCTFPCAQCGKIVLVDTIGLGSTALDIREQMLETVSNDSDAIVLMTRPDAQRPSVVQDDIDIVADISEKMTAEYTRQMMFWIVNRVSNGSGENVEGIPAVLNQLKRMTDFPVAAFLEVDCKNSKDVEENLLIPVLEKLSVNILKMDQLMIKNAQEQLNKVYQEYHIIAERAGRAFSASIDQDARREFDNKISKTYKKMTNSIRDLYLNEPYGGYRNKPCEELESAIEEKLLNIIRGIPEKGEVLKLLNDGSINQHNAYEKLTDKIRLNIINDFLELNVTLHDLAMKMKCYIVHCLADESQGRLGYLISACPDDADSWLHDFILYLKGDPNYEIIAEAVQKLMDFDIKMESFLIYRVRAHLDVIDISISHGPKLQGSLAEKEILADNIVFWLTHNLEIVYKEIREEMKPLYNYPNSALWAVVKDFYDRIVYAYKEGEKSERSREIGAKDAWRYLYEDSIAHIWQKEYNEYHAKKGVSERWNMLMNEIHRYDDRSTFQIVHEEE